MALNIEKHTWQSDFPNEIWVIDKRKQDEFQITLKQGSDDIEIEFNWDYGYGGRGNEVTTIPVQLLKDLLIELKLL